MLKDKKVVFKEPMAGAAYPAVQAKTIPTIKSVVTKGALLGVRYRRFTDHDQNKNRCYSCLSAEGLEFIWRQVDFPVIRTRMLGVVMLCLFSIAC